MWVGSNDIQIPITTTKRDKVGNNIAQITPPISGEKEAKAQLAPSAKPHTGGRASLGINAAVRELGIDRTEAQRAVKIADFSLFVRIYFAS